MSANNPYSVYKSNSVNYASKEQLLLMLVDGAVKYSKIGRQALVDNDMVKAHKHLVTTQEIFAELMASLDLSKSGEWGKQLMMVYDFIHTKLVEANIKKSVEILDSIIPLIEDIRDTWYEAEKLSKVQAQAK
ncbi:flagellar export chaperone FliS [Clostridium sp. 19966]|uniref:flagellar export chaperone FliS n=1 Tax=Clostridium sp. 19966 TaxID=2768166 RepID=UPI0028DEE9FC|nr:flagellar export chaperone FliS [Clostridium sp. 19966]MDT8716667.1 flagellar export chaperone FliS [Clostridium sp. 19966]